MPRILIIDDDGRLRAVLRAMLEEDGHEVEEAGDGAEGLRALRSRPFDLLLCDVFMPGQDGLETLRAVRGEFPGLPVVSMSGGGFDGRMDLLGVARLLGASQTLHKPFTGQALSESVRRAVGSAAEKRGSAPASP